ncbi:MAG TPA: EAL domain-containing protein [Micropepsaceae bacterium]|nr:EAL domain-containing protein [Micropepsaceae bacterium]
MIEPARLLAFAFAGADLLFEVDRAGTVLFATGAITGYSDSSELAGKPAAELFRENERARFTIIVRGLSAGERVGPLTITLASGDKATLSLCYLPQNNRISCALAKRGNRAAIAGIDAETGLVDRSAFVSAAGNKIGGESAMALVNVANLNEICASLSPEAAAGLMAAIGTNLKTMEGGVAARVSATGFGVVTETLNAAGKLADRIQNPARERGINNLEMEQVLLSLKGRNLSPEQNILALRHVIERFAQGKHKTLPGADLAQIFETMMDETVARAQHFCTTVAEGNFDLVFEPIVELKTGAVTHYEALTRFRSGHSPADTIRFAEDLELADSFDLALIMKAFNLLEEDSAGTRIAINISARSISDPSSFSLLSALLMRRSALAKRVLIEVTETVELPDLVAADRAIQILRRMGYRVGIDDFGAGAATLQYLHGLTVDFVKVDGGLIEKLGKSAREDALVRSVLASCSELGVETIAEWIDSPEKLKRCKTFGFQFGQGRHFGVALNGLPTAARPLQRRHRGS